jgi:hypothetical protein
LYQIVEGSLEYVIIQDSGKESEELNSYISSGFTSESYLRMLFPNILEEAGKHPIMVNRNHLVTLEGDSYVLYQKFTEQKGNRELMVVPEY